MRRNNLEDLLDFPILEDVVAVQMGDFLHNFAGAVEEHYDEQIKCGLCIMESELLSTADQKEKRQLGPLFCDCSTRHIGNKQKPMTREAYINLVSLEDLLEPPILEDEAAVQMSDFVYQFSRAVKGHYHDQIKNYYTNIRSDPEGGNGKMARKSEHSRRRN